jgi:release factor glutamine methyltransferase
MRRSLKHLASLVLIPAVKWYLRKPRNYRYNGIEMVVIPGVFHPGFFSSTKFLLKYLKVQELENKHLLELGCGSGLISIVAAKAGAKVTASDISEKAIKNASVNARKNNVAIKFVVSDLFDNFEKKQFDWIVINPPYYARAPRSVDEYAWYCGEHFEYFEKLFSTLNDFIHHQSKTLMVLTKGCELEKIFEIARHHGYGLNLIMEKRVLFDEKDFLYEIKKIS